MRAKAIQPIFLAVALLIGVMPAPALIMSGSGNSPTYDPGWPEGALAVANLQSRLGYWEGPPFGGGEWHFLYRGDTEHFTQTLAAFAAIRTPSLELVIHDGPQTDQFLQGDQRYEWSFMVWVPENWHRLYNNPKSWLTAGEPNFRKPVEAPRLDVYIGNGDVDWAKVKVPENIHVSDERASAVKADLTGGAQVSVEVFDMSTGKPVHSVHVLVASAVDPQKPQGASKTDGETTGDDLGHAKIAKIPPGWHWITIEAPGFATRALGYESYDAHTFKELRVELAKSAAIRGVARDADDQPVKDAKVRAYAVLAIDGLGYDAPGAKEAVTDGGGGFVIEGLPAGYVQLMATATGYHFGDIGTIHEVPETNVVLRLASTGGILVSVAGKDGRPLAQFSGHPLLITVEPAGGLKQGSWGGGATPREDGSFEFTDVPPGQYRIVCRPNPSFTNTPFAPDQIVTVEAGARAAVKITHK